MKKILLTVLILLMTTGVALAEGFSVTSPMETSVVGFWFPRTGTFAGGLSHTVLRVSHSAVPIVSLDVDGTIAQEFSDNNDTLAGLGVKMNFYVTKAEGAGFAFLPNIGLTALNNFKEASYPKDILENYEIALYGTLVQYRW